MTLPAPRSTERDRNRALLRFAGVSQDVLVNQEMDDQIGSAVMWAVAQQKIAPPPHHCDGRYLRYRETILSWLDGDLFGGSEKLFVLALPAPGTSDHVWEGGGSLDVIEPDHLRCIGRAWHLAPFVGDPFFYWWRIAEDDRGRRVAGRQQIRHIEEWEYERLRGREPWNF
jgi:hypothetical protein